MMREHSFPSGGFDPGLADGKSAASTWRHHGLVTWVSQDGEMVDMKMDRNDEFTGEDDHV